MRALSLHLAWWSADRARRREACGPDVVLPVRDRAGQRIVAGVDAVGWAHGVRAGQSLAEARTRLAGRRVRTPLHDPEGDARALRALARWVERRWSPAVGVDPPDGLLLDISGCAHLFGGEHGLMGSLERGMARLGLTVRLGVASSVGAAWALARFTEGEDARAMPGEERRALASLPLEALRLEPAAVESLREVGVERVGELLELPRHALALRYGAGVLRRIDQALGASPEPIERTEESARVVASRELAGGTTRPESIRRAVRELLSRVGEELDRRQGGLGWLELRFARLGLGEEVLVLRVARATRDGRHLWSLISPRLERLPMGFGVERVTLTAGGIVRLAHRQACLLGEREGSHRDAGALAALLDSLASRLGRGRVLRARVVSSHRPERAFALGPFDEGEGGGRVCAGLGPRPTRVFERPRAARVVALRPDGPVVRASWAGRERALGACVGPERVSGEWWRGPEATRDYYRVRDEEGRWHWLLCDLKSGEWFVHGEWC